MKKGETLGPEFMDAGLGITLFRKGDRVAVPVTICCGQCYFCGKSMFAACETTDPERGAILDKKNVCAGAGLFGYSHRYGGYAEGRAEFLRVPQADIGPMVIPVRLADEQVRFRSRTLPTGYQDAVNAEIGARSTVAILGAGQVGLMTASCRLLGAERISTMRSSPQASLEMRVRW